MGIESIPVRTVRLPSIYSTTLSLAIVTLLPPLKRIRTLNLAQLPKLSLFDPQPKPPIESVAIPIVETPRDILLQIGAGLRQWREYYGLSIDELSASTQIQPRLIQAIEEGHIEMLPESVYVRGMVKRYGDRIGLNGTAIAQNVPTWQREEADFTAQTATRTATAFHPPRRIAPLYLYLGYTLAIVAIGAGSSHLINDAFKPKAAILLPPVTTSQPAAIPARSAVNSASE
jgi:Helix-turn-helix domain